MMAVVRQLFGSSRKRTHESRGRVALRRPPLGVEVLADRVMLSATPLRLAVLADSLSAPYAGEPYGGAVGSKS